MKPVARHRRNTVGVLAGWQFYWTATPLSYLSPLFEGIRAAARDADVNLLLACGIGLTASPDDPFRPAWPEPAPEADFVPVGPWNTDGLIVINPLHSPARSRYIQELKRAGHPVLFVGAGEGPPEIIADNAQGIRQAIQHLAEHGHRRIAFIAGSQDDLAGDSGDRLHAFQAAVAADRRLASDPALVAYGRHVFDGGYAAMQAILASGSPFTAVLASNDESAFGAMRALKEAGLRIPEDVALIGFDDRLETLIQTPPLTSVRIPLYDLGYQALQSLLQMLAGQNEAHLQRRIHTRLMLRRSCGCSQDEGALPSDDALTLPETAPANRRQRLVQAMTQAVQLEARHLKVEEIQRLCEGLVVAFDAGRGVGNWPAFQQALDDILRRCEGVGEDISLWQAALSILRREMPALIAAERETALSSPIAEALDRAFVRLAQNNRRQVRHNAVVQRQMLDRLAHLTAQLLQVTDEAQVFEVLARHLPDMDIQRTLVAFFEAEGDDPIAWSAPHLIPPTLAAPARFASRQFPPPDVYPADQPLSLVLLPLICQRARNGYVVFDAVHLPVYGSIVPQLAAALDRAQLYRDAVEGRRLAEEADRLKSRFLSTVSHELRMPLNLIVGLSEIALKESDEDGPPLPDPLRQDLERIYTNAQHLSGLIGDVLDLASSDAGQLRLNHELVDLGQALQLVAGIGRQLASDKGLAWRAALPESGPWVWGDRTRLRQIVLNLVNNAIKFTTHGEVSLSVAASPEVVTVAVRDTGIGIPPEEQPFIFDEFRRSQRSLNSGYGGLGLGLAICKRLVELQAGSLRLESTGVDGEGSLFCVTLPAAAPPTQPAGPPLTEQSVLVLTGQPGGGGRLPALLSRHGFDVHVAPLEGAREQLAQLLAAPPAVIVVEFDQAAERGWEILKTLRDNPASQQIPVLFYTLIGDQGAVLELDYLMKPIGVTEITRALDQQWLITGEAAEKTILIVDDDPNTVEMHARLVHSHSARYRILKAYNGREALALLAYERADLVLLDLLMPELDGFGVLEAMRASAATRDTPVIVLTGQTLTEADMQRLNQGVATILSKGLFNADETVAHIQAALGRQRKLGGQAQRLVRLAMAYIHAHYAEPLTREGLARHLGMNEDYLTLCFRKELNMTPIAYLNRYRVNQAKALLTDSDKSITEIALAVGFSDSGYFSRVFRQKVGLSPEAFRRG